MWIGGHLFHLKTISGLPPNENRWSVAIKRAGGVKENPGWFKPSEQEDKLLHQI